MAESDSVASPESPRSHVRFASTRWLREHPAPRFVVTGGLTLCVDLIALRIAHGTLGVPLAYATAAAFGLAFVVNFTLSRQWAFVSGRDGRAHHQAIRFLILVLINLVTTLAIVTGLAALGLNYLLAKLIATALNAVGNFVAYRRWVFASPTS
jgi:putative flippase GtrA